MRKGPLARTRQQQRRAGVLVPDTEYPLSAMENQPATLHCDVCELGAGLHRQWRSVDGYPVTVRCLRHDEKAGA